MGSMGNKSSSETDLTKLAQPKKGDDQGTNLDKTHSKSDLEDQLDSSSTVQRPEPDELKLLKEELEKLKTENLKIGAKLEAAEARAVMYFILLCVTFFFFTYHIVYHHFV